MTTVVTYFLLFIEVAVSFLLIGIILIQKTKSQGMGLAFGSGMGESLFGSHVGNVLTKTTVILAIVFLVNTTLLAMLGAGRSAGSDSVTDALPDAVPPAAPIQAQAPQDMPIPEPMPSDIPAVTMDTPPMSVPAAPAEADADAKPPDEPTAE